MEEYPEELRTPPVALAALVGCSDHHPAISGHLHSLQPPMNVLALPDFSKVQVVLARKAKDPAASGDHPPGGILRRDWLLKHRTRVPAVVAAMFAADRVSGDPAQWLQVCSELEGLKAAARPRNVKLVVIVVQSSSADEINEDRMIALRKRAEVDSKYLVTYTPSDALELTQSLNRLANTVVELANTYYRDEGRRIKTRVEKKSFSSIELNIRYCFKVAVYAEFRRDWVEALRFYEEAYRVLREMIGTSTRLPPIQRLVEIKHVAEQLHFKVSTLLLHGGKIIEAVTWFRHHNASYKRLIGAPEAIYLHWEWMSRQFLVFAELLETSSATTQSISSVAADNPDRGLTEWEFRPAYYYQLAAHYLKKKRSSLDIALSMLVNANEIDGRAESVAPSTFVGQFSRLLEQGDGLSFQPIDDEEYIHYALAEGKRFQDSYEIIALFKKSYESYGNLKVQRMGSTCGLEIAKEYFSAGDFTTAMQFFDNFAQLYRQEGWVILLWEALGYSRECSKKMGAVKNFVESSLEMASLPVSSDDIQSLGFKECGPAGPPSLPERESIHKEVLELVSGESGIRSVEESNDLNVTEGNPLHLEIDLVSPLRSVLLASVAFHEQTVKPGASTLMTLSLLSQLPLTTEIDQLEVQFNQSEYNFTITNAARPQSTSKITSGQQNNRVEIAASLSLVTNKWLRLTYGIKSEQSGKLECISVIAKLGPHFTIFCRAESPASMDGLPLWKFEDCVETYPTKDPALAITGQKVIQVEEAEPLVDLNLGDSGAALVGESFMVPVSIVARGHDIYSGELKINLVDVKGGGLFSPREIESSTMDGHHVELLSVAGAEWEDESQKEADKINNIQQSFGLVSIPFLKIGDTWSCKLEIKWHRPKPIMLYVSLGYSPHGNEFNAQKIHVHKSLQIEGKNPVLISHRFMLPFRRDPLLLSKMKAVSENNQFTSLPLNETSILILSAKNCTEVPLQVESLSVEVDEDCAATSCSIKPGSEVLANSGLLVPGEEFRKVFMVIPQVNSSTLGMGTVLLRWRRDPGSGEQVSCIQEDSVLTRHKLPDVNVELAPLTITLECPPYGILGDPFTYFIKIHNQTQLLQEVKFSLADSQSFVLSGSHNGTVYVLPKSEHILSYKLVPLASGSLQLPKVTLTSVRYSAGFQPSVNASTVFVYPSKPHFKVADQRESRTESVAAK
ncbi:trafficking protein particle complex subunit 11 [Eucalyptus grandis]|uniref:trafficking protein particle complex subunit 11 n=1 Tax=Eucalyptus grandis TaxID=71139 RepID=UPI00192E9A5B|nr:trafficking protein particle complex subunit 11 [Eucalyptus grandis]